MDERCKHERTHAHDVIVMECSKCYEVVDHPWKAETERLRDALERARAATYGLKIDLEKLHDVALICDWALASTAASASPEQK
jgi:hypothetical protein